METRTENTVVENVISLPGAPINAARFENEKKYRVSMKVASSMLTSGIITNEEYAIIDTKIREKFQPISCVIL